jgi:hypothetical protein
MGNSKKWNEIPFLFEIALIETINQLVNLNWLKQLIKPIIPPVPINFLNRRSLK